MPRSPQAPSRRLSQEVADHLRLRVPAATGGPDYGPLQKLTYCFVIFVAAPLMVLTGITIPLPFRPASSSRIMPPSFCPRNRS
jgi:thiosulfate reductase cytochrome b subunit